MSPGQEQLYTSVWQRSHSSASGMSWRSYPQTLFVIVGCGAEGYIRLYRLADNGRKLELVHKTAVGGIPGALAGFKGRLLVGVGPIVRLYDLGKKKLLRKSEYRR